jgi:thiosulfate reductase/polysulfide reductase chain A
LLGSWGRPGGFYAQEKVALPGFPAPEPPKPKQDWKAEVQARFPLVSTGISNVMIDASAEPDAFFKGWFVYATNLTTTVPAVREQLERAAQSLELVVVIDTVPAEITGYADVVLPECTYLERFDDLRNKAERTPTLALRMPAFAPKYDSKPAWWIAKGLAEKLGLDDYFPWQDYREVLDWQLKQVGSSLAEIEQTGVKAFPRKTPVYFTAGEPIKFNTPSGKIELYSQTLVDTGHDPLPRYAAPQRPPAGYFHLNYGRAAAHTFGRTINNPLLFELMPENTVWVHPAAAARLGVANGDYVRLENPAGRAHHRGVFQRQCPRRPGGIVTASGGTAGSGPAGRLQLLARLSQRSGKSGCGGDGRCAARALSGCRVLLCRRLRSRRRAATKGRGDSADKFQRAATGRQHRRFGIGPGSWR